MAAVSAPAALRNRTVILEVLSDLLPSKCDVLEIGSGSGEHAEHFVAALPGVRWPCRDLRETLAAIEARTSLLPAESLPAPLELDVRDPPWLADTFDIVYSANTAHIMALDAVEQMLSLGSRVLGDGGRFMYYGPLRIEDKFTSDSNCQFDLGLRNRNPEMGIRDLEWMDEQAGENGMLPEALYGMPSNNLFRVWKKGY